MKYACIAIAAFMLSSAPFSSAKAEDLISLGIGYFNAGESDGAADFRLEYRFGNPILWQIKPWLGAEATSDGGVYAGGGLVADIDINDEWVLTPGFGLGLFGKGSGKDLDDTLQFRPQIELGYKFNDNSRMSASYSRFSNLDMDNSGTHVLGVYYHLPASWVFH